ncbi:MAG: hypothetical protein LBF84_04375 [Holosporales bacterium]|jgi:MATE family multidrug resistance protein|nr:hypothetical protein [Holosporales bacterium]
MLSGTERAKQELDCGVASLLLTALPVIASIFSSVFMQLVDRVMLAHFSSTAMNAAGFASQAVDVFLLPLLSFAGVSEVFVGQFNGARQFKNAALPVVQISVFLLICWLAIVPFALHNADKMIAQDLFTDGYPYFVISVFMMPFQITFASIASFFVGTRRPNSILYSVILSNLINFLLDFLLIFGITGVIEPLGTTGAALASLISSVVSAVILLGLFFSPSNANLYGSRNFSVSMRILKKNIALGAPYAVSELIEMTVWVWILHLLIRVSIDAVTIHNVCIAIWIFFCFVIDGLQKGVTALSSNCIGANKENLIKKLIGSMAKITIVCFVLSAIPLVIFSEQLLYYVFKITNSDILPMFKTAIALLWCILSLSVFSTSGLAGILSSGGDTLFVTSVRLCTIALCIAVPCFFASRTGAMDALTTWKLCCIQQGIHAVCFYLRYKSGRWKKDILSTG